MKVDEMLEKTLKEMEKSLVEKVPDK